jgi:hypothetical protein
MAIHQLTHRTTIIYSDTKKMQEIIIIIFHSIQHHVQVGDYNGLWESGPLKKGEEDDEDVGEDGDIDEDDRRDDGSPGCTPVRPEGQRSSLQLLPPWPPPRWGEVMPFGLWPP